MSLEELRSETRRVTGLCLSPLLVESLDRKNPAIVTPTGDQILIFSDLSDAEKIEAEGHELSHLLLEYNGLFTPVIDSELDDDYAEGPFQAEIFKENEWFEIGAFLVSELRMAVHHPEVFKLNTIYGISNALQSEARFTPLNEMIVFLKKFSSYVPIHHGYGFQLYDVHTTIEPLDQYIGELSYHFTEVKRAFEVAKEYLPHISNKKSLQEQLNVCRDLIQSLGYNRNLIKIGNRKSNM